MKALGTQVIQWLQGLTCNCASHSRSKLCWIYHHRRLQLLRSIIQCVDRHHKALELEYRMRAWKEKAERQVVDGYERGLQFYEATAKLQYNNKNLGCLACWLVEWIGQTQSLSLQSVVAFQQESIGRFVTFSSKGYEEANSYSALSEDSRIEEEATPFTFIVCK